MSQRARSRRPLDSRYTLRIRAGWFSRPCALARSSLPCMAVQYCKAASNETANSTNEPRAIAGS